MPRKPPMTSTERSVARYARAAKVLPPVPLDASRAKALARILARTKESYAAWIRRLIDETA